MLPELNSTPCITTVPKNYRPLWELCLADVWCPTSVQEWRKRIDSPKDMDFTQTLFVNLSVSDKEELTRVFGFPTIALPEFPSIKQVNQALPHQFKINNLLKQSDLAAEIIARFNLELPELVVLLVFDGLSFYDVVNWELPYAKLTPCLVDGLSATDASMRRLIGSPVLTHQLFELGYPRRLGFSYWEREVNQLTDVLFLGFARSQLRRVTTFHEVLDTIRISEWSAPTYIQIIRSGLDRVCHSHRERPDITGHLENLKQDVLKLITTLRETGQTFRIFMTADHGILWYTDQDVVSLAREKSKARYTEGHVASGANVLTLNTDGSPYTVLTGDKVIAKQRRVTEWGFHGGVSAQESLVPFWDICG